MIKDINDMNIEQMQKDAWKISIFRKTLPSTIWFVKMQYILYILIPIYVWS